METPNIELTSEQKDLLKSLSQETGKPISTLIAEALEGLQAQIRPGSINGERASDVDEATTPGAPAARRFAPRALRAPMTRAIWRSACEK